MTKHENSFFCFALTFVACLILKDEEIRKGYEEYMEKEYPKLQNKGNENHD